jgi:hypothetical protein
MISVRLAAGTLIDIEFQDALSSGTNLAGDTFRAMVLTDVTQGGSSVIPAGSTIVGSVEEVVSARNKKIGGRARMELSFDTLTLPGGDVAISAWLSEKGKSETAKDAATIGGAAAGTAIAAKTQGKEIQLPAGAVAVIELGAPIDIDVPK